MTADEFIRVYGEGDEDRYELIDGTVCESTLNGYSHDRVKNNLKKLFDRSGVDRLDSSAGLNTVFGWGIPA